MSRVRLTFFYELGDTGWSESLHTTLDASATGQLQNLVQKYITNRLPILTAEANMTHVRVSDDETFRDIIFQVGNLPLSGQYKITGAAGPWTALLVRLQSTPTLLRNLFLRGLPQGEHDGRNPTFNGAFLAGLQAFTTLLQTNPFGISGKSAIASAPIISLTRATGALITAAAIPGVAQGDVLQILGVPTSLVPVRTMRVLTVVLPTSVIVAGYTGPDLANQGFVRPVRKAVVALTSVVTGRFTERRVGRPFGLLRGRARR